MVTETDRNKARSAVVSAYQALDCVTIPFSFLHAFADAAVDAVSTDAEPGTVLKNAIRAVSEAFDPSSMLPITENQAQRRAIRSLNRLSALYAEPVKTAPAVAVKAGPLAHALADELERMGQPRPNGDILHDALSRVLPALSAQVQDMAVEPCTEKSTDLSIPEGYVLLPIEPTQAMIMAYNRAGDDLGLSAYPNARIAYDAMVKTAPSASLRKKRDSCGWKLVPKEPSPEQLQTAAFNLSAEYGPEFVLANEAFARDVYAELVAASPASKHGDAE